MSASSKRVLLPLRPRRRRAPSRPTPGTELGESRRGPLPPTLISSPIEQLLTVGNPGREAEAAEFAVTSPAPSTQSPSRYRKKYLAQRNKLIGMLEEMHLTSSDVQFDEKKQVSADEYKSEKRKVKHIIRKVKSDAARKELVLRIELIKQAIYNEWHLEDIDDLIENAKNFTYEMIGDVEIVHYDGQNLVDILSRLRKDARKSATDHDEKNKLTAGLRLGNLYKK
ncbi:hypothetical protein SETIT_5G445900v2 [Setaria italica]|uniref:Uncharacterized protein n=1 Tax=Setaria italica TaxID=4555 RepID=A0A368RFP5_SETIT|nr:uncharacterized protein LOC101782582 [Setaria italica]RCV28971.1 hypothetical protein SETIT_5G445900v2 [Setaria italica]